MVLFRTRNGSIARFIYGTPKWFYIEPFCLVKGSIGQVWNPRVLYRTQRKPFFKSVFLEPFRGSKYVALIEPFKECLESECISICNIHTCIVRGSSSCNSSLI